MIFNETTALAQTVIASDDELEAAFRVLATFSCSCCRRPLTKESQNVRTHWQRNTEPHVCCGVAHCPYCGKPASERCRHLVAFKEYGRWSIPGFRGKAARTLPTLAPAHDLPDSQLMDFEDDQKEEAFRTAAPFLNLLYTEGFASKSDTKVPLGPVLGPNFFEGDHCMEVNTSGRNNYFHFSKDPEGTRAQALQIFQDLEEGIRQMKSMTPSAARFLVREIEPPAAEGEAISILQFSPDGRLLLVGLRDEGQLWDVETGALLQRLPIEMRHDRITATFSQDSTRLALASSSLKYSYSNQEGNKDVAETTIFDVESGQVIDKIPAVSLSTRAMGVTTDSLLAQGTVLARARGRFIYLNPIGKEGAGLLGSSRTIRLPHRTSIRLCAFSPDGNTFATVPQNWDGKSCLEDKVLIWRMTSRNAPHSF